MFAQVSSLSLLNYKERLRWRKFGSLALCVDYTCATSGRLVLLCLSYYAAAQVGLAKAKPHTCAIQ